MRNGILTLLFGLSVGCGSSETPEVVETPKAEPPSKDFGAIDMEKLEEIADQVNLVPSPLKMQEELQKAGVASKLSAMVASDRNLSMDIESLDQVAIRTGVVLADVVLTINTATPEQLQAYLKSLKDGFGKVKAGNDIQLTIDEMLETVGTEGFDRAGLLEEIDALSNVMVPELECEAGEWVVPLIQAGSWLEGANLVSGTIQKDEKYAESKSLFHQPGAAKYFLRYVQREGRDKAPDAIIAKLESTLTDLDKLAQNTELSKEQIDLIYSMTSELLSLL